MLDWLKEIFIGLQVDVRTQLALLMGALVLTIAWQVVTRAAAIHDRRVAGRRAALLQFYSPARDLLELRVHAQITEEEFRKAFRDLLIAHGGYRHLDDYESAEVIPVVRSFTTSNSFDPIKALAAFEDEVDRLESSINLGPHPWDLMVQAGSWALKTVTVLVSVALALASGAAGITYLVEKRPSPVFVILVLFVVLAGVAGVYLAGFSIQKLIHQRRISNRTKELRSGLRVGAELESDAASSPVDTGSDRVPKQATGPRRRRPH